MNLYHSSVEARGDQSHRIARMIARDSKSYPFLALSRELGIDYGVVLRFADVVRHGFLLIPREAADRIRKLVLE